MKLREYILKPKHLNEAAYHGNMGFEEMCKFYQMATEEDISEMKKVTKKEDWEAFKKLIYKVINIKLK